ncbi:hypothetical protein [Paenirhodobacter sp. CAU 1674]|uniref:phage head-tail joining protein n=1 Tax=Paenirhodobacter sp. CAU 1674 TaxID=3032596 RepID=UPI0023DA6951|nr:hypothetical protein [Paenirhodobacter sp. CAU 1674]MDF2140850.1 hypothetical protein [Paenirhodobacter sp. CAU 1674]
MMATTIDEKIAALEEALASGELTVEYDGKRITYRSTQELMTSLNYFRGVKSSQSRGTSVRVSIGAFGG